MKVKEQGDKKIYPYNSYFSPKNTMASIKEIAKITGLSTATVSRVFNNSSLVSNATRKKVLQAADALEYRPNKIAAALRSGKSNIIGVIVPEIGNHFFSNIINGIEKKLSEQDYNIIIAQSHESSDIEKNALLSFLQLHVDGVLLSVAEETTDFSIIKRYKKLQIPVIFFDRLPNITSVHSVILDDYEGGVMATEHLIRMGCTHTIHIAGNAKVSIFKKRCEGFLDTLKKHRHPIFEDSIIRLSANADTDRLILKKCFKKHPDIDGIFAHGDVHSLYVMNILRSLAIDVAKHIKIIGFGNTDFTAHAHPSMSTIDQKCDTMGRLAAELLLKNLEDKKMTSTQHVLSPELVVRASTQRS